ncbi:alpha/beta fold hydrolase [Gordonia sp. DT219]|uniref:alpha/beta fold hydrolase n=1 Tax=Gordonia sp. DT219 TaxID=3416658 RepID=UPI003CEC8FA2
MTTLQQASLPAYDHRRGTGPTLVFLHYWGGSARTWNLVIDHLPGRDILAIDARGWSRSRDLPGPYALRRLAEDTLSVIEREQLTDYVLVGHSMGGKVAQVAAATRPDGLRGIVLVASGPAAPPAGITPAYRESLSHAYDTDESAIGARDQILTATTLSETIAEQVLTDSRSWVDDDARTEWPLHGIAEDITEHTRTIGVRALVRAGEHDVVEPVAVLRDNLLPYLSDAEFSIIPSTGHLIPLEAPNELADALRRFRPGPT